MMTNWSPDDMLRTFSDICEEHHILMLLVFGTCLGPVRDQSLISYDSDLDVACYIQDREKIVSLFPVFIERGFELGRIDPNKMVFKSSHSKIVVDLWFIEPAYNPLMVLMGNRWFFESGYYTKDFFNVKKLGTAICHGKTYLVPNLVEEFLEDLYGSDWRTPIQGRHAVYRAFLSRVLHHLFLESDMPVRYSSEDSNTRFRPWVNVVAVTFLPNSKLTKKYKR